MSLQSTKFQANLELCFCKYDFPPMLQSGRPETLELVCCLIFVFALVLSVQSPEYIEIIMGDLCYEESFSWSLSHAVSEAHEAFESLSNDEVDPVSNLTNAATCEKSFPLAKDVHKIYAHRSDEEIDDRKPEFLHVKAAWEAVEEEIDPKGAPLSEEVEICFKRLGDRGIVLIEGYAKKRRNRLKYMDAPPSILATFQFPPYLISRQSLAPEVQFHHTQALLRIRNYIFSLPDFTNTTTASLRHTCMGILADSYKVYSKLVEDLDSAAGKICPGHFWTSKGDEMMEFLREIEARDTLAKVCVYSVITRASSGAKSDLRAFYLNLLAQKHKTTPFLAQEFVPGFTYENIDSIEDVLTLIESKVEKPLEDEEVEEFRNKISRVKVPEQRVVPILSQEFVARIQRRIRES